MNVVVLLGWLPIAGVIAGLGRAKFRRLPLIVAAIVAVAYVATMLSFTAWAATCWDCTVGVSETRGDVVIIVGTFFGLYVALTLAGVWLGARFSGSAGRLLGTLREVRRELRSGPPHRE